MVISASRRTDIPAFYSDWFFKRLLEGYVLVRNPMNLRHISKISLKRENVDCIVFWTKNPANMLPKLHLLEGYNYYFQFTLNPYDATDDFMSYPYRDMVSTGKYRHIEPGLPRKTELIETYKRLADKIGPSRVIWRYDPIIISDTINVNYHDTCFELMAMKLRGYVAKCVLSFVDYYKKIDKSFRAYGMIDMDDEKKRELALRIHSVARAYNFSIETCAEEIDLEDIGIGHSRCIDPILIDAMKQVVKQGTVLCSTLLEQRTVPCFKKDRNQRKACGCIASTDIGAYNTCAHGCVYCYANYSSESVKRNMDNYDVDSPLLCSKLMEGDRLFDK